MIRASLVVLTCAGSLLLVACGGNPALENAQTTLALSSRVLTDLDQRVSRGPSGFGTEQVQRAPQGTNDPVFRNVRTNVIAAQRELHQAEQVVDRWVEDDEQAGMWQLVLPCLSRSLASLQQALTSFGVEPGVDLEQLVTSTAAETNGSVCIPQRH